MSDSSDAPIDAPVADTEVTNHSRLKEWQELLAPLDAPEIVDELGRMDSTDRALAFRLLNKDLAMEVFEDLDPALQRELIEALRDDATVELLEGLDPDDRAVLLEELPAAVVARMLSGLSAHERAMTTTLLGYPVNSTGRRMSPEVVSVLESATVGEALARIRQRGADAETIYLIPVVATGRRVVGVVSLRRLFVTDDDTPVAEVMSEPVMIDAREDQEVAARVMRDNGMLAVPVVDGEERLLGIFTVDDAMRVLELEETEDAALSGATAPLRRPYLSVNVFGLVKARVLWLMVLLVAASLTVQVLGYYEATLDEVIALALFVPLLIGTGGNAGAQAATTVVRAMAVGDVRMRDWLRVMGREMLTGLLLGSLLGAVGFVPAGLFAGWDVATVLVVSVIFVCLLATTAGATIPILAAKLGRDPAVVSAPFITTVVDATGLVIYFVVAQAILGIG